MIVTPRKRKHESANRKTYDDSSEEESDNDVGSVSATNPPGRQGQGPESAPAEEAPALSVPFIEVTTRTSANSSSRTVSSSSDITGDNEEYILKEPELFQQLSAQLKEHVTKMFFPKCKFRTEEKNELKVCKHAVLLGNCRLPDGVSSDAFAKIYHKIVRIRQNALRANAHNSAKWKFEGKCDRGHWNF